MREELRQQIKDWLAKNHQLTRDNMESISLLWAAYDHLKINSAEPDIGITATENEPITLDELRGMRGEPVYMVDTEKPKCSGWCLVSKYYDGSTSLYFPDNEYYEIAIKRGSVLAYRRKPEGV